jgi:hypothetical protein
MISLLQYKKIMALNDFVWANNIDYVFGNTKLSGIKTIFVW